MKRNEWNEGLNHLDPDLVENYVVQKEVYFQKKKAKNQWLRFGAVAACVVLIVGGFSAALMLHGDQPAKSPPPSIPTWDDARLSAEEVSKLFEFNDNAAATNAYTEVFVPDAAHLRIGELPEEEFIGVYRYTNEGDVPKEKEVRSFVDGFLPRLTVSLDATILEYEVRKIEHTEALNVDVRMDPYVVWAWQYEGYCYTSVTNLSWSHRIVLDGETVQIDQRLPDDEILTSLQTVKEKLFAIFGASFFDAKIVRRYGPYSEYGAEQICVYFYDKGAHPLNSTQDEPVSDYICLDFDNFENSAEDNVSKGVLTDVSVRYKKNRKAITEECACTANARRISLEEAEALLYKGYVFGGHVCPLCMAEQDKVSFEDYDFVDVEYVFGWDLTAAKPTMGLPFYAFYKEVKTSENGNHMYAKAYVPAIEVSGWDECFEKQTNEHGVDMDDVIVEE